MSNAGDQYKSAPDDTPIEETLDRDVAVTGKDEGHSPAKGVDDSLPSNKGSSADEA